MSFKNLDRKFYCCTCKYKKGKNKVTFFSSRLEKREVYTAGKKPDTFNK